MGPNRQKWPKSGKNQKNLEKIRRGRKKNFGQFFFDIFGKNTYFPAKYRKFSPFLLYQAFFWKKSKNLKNIKKKSEKIEKADNAKNFGRGEKKKFFLGKKYFLPTYWPVSGHLDHFCAIYVKMSKSQIFYKKSRKKPEKAEKLGVGRNFFLFGVKIFDHNLCQDFSPFEAFLLEKKIGPQKNWTGHFLCCPVLLEPSLVIAYCKLMG